LAVAVRSLDEEPPLPYAGLADLLRRIGTLIYELPCILAAELGAPAIGPPAGGNRFAVDLATIGMLSVPATTYRSW
jgi:hypothetical protein